MLSALDISPVYGKPGVVNRDYQGDSLQAGNSVKVASISDVSIGDYTRAKHRQRQV